MINITVDRLRWLVRERKYLTLDGAVEIAKCSPDLLAEIERLRAEISALLTQNTEVREQCVAQRDALQQIADAPSKEEVSGSMAEDMAALARSVIHQQQTTEPK